MTVAEVERVLQITLAVRADIKRDPEALRGVHTRADRVEHELPDRNPVTVDAEATETEDAFTVCHDDHVHFFLRCVIENLREMPLILDREEHAAGEAEEMAVLLAEVTDGRRVDHGEQFIHVIHQHAEEESLIRRAERVKEDALLKRRGEAVIDLHHRFFLHADRGRHRGGGVP